MRKRLLRLLLLLLGASLLLAGGYLGWVVASLPQVDFLADPGATIEITVRDWQGGERPFLVGPRNPDWTPLPALPPALVDALVAAEDGSFFSHRGVDWAAVREAAERSWKAGRITHGGSTITQQLAKNLFLSRERTFTRKARELVLARRMERSLGKQRILELYLNAVEFGPRVNGAPAAARHYFGRPVSSLSVRECAFLVAMLPSPRVYDPYRKPERVERATDRVIRLMLLTRKLTPGEAEAARTATLALLPRATALAAPETPEEAAAEEEERREGEREGVGEGETGGGTAVPESPAPAESAPLPEPEGGDPGRRILGEGDASR